MPLKLIHVDCDVTGSISIRHLIPQWIETYRAPTFRDVAGIIDAIRMGQIKGDAVALDTITGMTGTVRQDIDLDPDKARLLNVWENRNKLKSTRETYYTTADLVNRLSRPLRELPIPSIIVAHEKHSGNMVGRADPLTQADKYIPNLQAEINANLFAFADGIVRLSPSPSEFEWQGVKYPRFTRLLTLTANSDSTAGVRVAGDIPQPPPIMVIHDNDPYAFKKFVEAIGHLPHNLLLYGPPKIGKTRFLSGIVYL